MIDALIIGQGLAGTILADVLRQKNWTVKLVDQGHQSAATYVAAGLFHPLISPKFKKNWQFETLYPAAQSYYLSCKEKFNTPFLVHKPLMHMFKTEKEKINFDLRKEDAESKPYIIKEVAQSESIPGIHNTRGGVKQKSAGYLRTDLFLTKWRQEFLETDALIEDIFDEKDLMHFESHIQWKTIKAKKIIFCTGQALASSTYFSWVPAKPIKGDIFTMSCDTLNPEQMVLKGTWIVPRENSTYKVGATYKHEFTTETPEKEGYNNLIRRLKEALKAPYTITKHQTGIRYVSDDAYPIIGPHPAYPNAWIFSALSSKGILTTPYFAEVTAEALVSEAPIPEEVALARFPY